MNDSITANRSLRAEYVSRINRAMDFIERNIGANLSLARVASEACFSPHHFHRIFLAMTGETLHCFIRRTRLEKAASQLSGNSAKSITEIALDCGFSTSAAFSRAFREQYGVAPRSWRTQHGRPGIQPRERSRSVAPEPRFGDWGEPDVDFVAADSSTERWRIRFTNDDRFVDVDVRNLNALYVAYVRHTGPYKGDAALFEKLFKRLCRWAAPLGLIRPPEALFLAVYHDDPQITEVNKLRISACLVVPEATRGKGEIGTMLIPAGRYAVARFQLAADEYVQAWNTVCGAWLPESGYQPDDRPFFEMFPGDVICDCRERHPVDICVPVRPL
jgi:AraC family transcriptional regulator